MAQKYIVEFPGGWYMRKYSATGATAAGGADRATKFASEAEARAALEACKRFFKAADVKAARVVMVECADVAGLVGGGPSPGVIAFKAALFA